jgi:hypothetical protein
MLALGYDPIVRDIPDFPNYQISENGEVYHKIKGREFKHTLNHRGYYSVWLDKKTVFIHRVLAQIFISNPENKDCVDHIDRDTHNNNLNNLRWFSNSENKINRSLPSGGVFKVNVNKYVYWRAQIVDNKKQYVKQFPYTNEGYELALLWRKEKEIEFGHNLIRT